MFAYCSSHVKRNIRLFFGSSVSQRVEGAGERLWRLADFRDLPFEAVAQTLSRMTRQGTLERLSKGGLLQNP